MFDAQIKALQDLAAWAEREGAETCATAIGAEARSDYQAGRSPAGDPWAPRKKDGAPALQRAPSRVTFRAVGAVVEQSAPDHYKYHRTGTVTMVKRTVYSETTLTLPMHWRFAAEKALTAQIERRTRALGA
jgi:hypothetical protein